MMSDQTRRAIVAELHHLVDELGGIPEEVAREQSEEWVNLTHSLGYAPDDPYLQDAALVIAQQVMGILLVQETVEPENPVVGCLKAVLYVLATTAFTKEME